MIRVVLAMTVASACLVSQERGSWRTRDYAGGNAAHLMLAAYGVSCEEGPRRGLSNMSDVAGYLNGLAPFEFEVAALAPEDLAVSCPMLLLVDPPDDSFTEGGQIIFVEAVFDEFGVAHTYNCSLMTSQILELEDLHSAWSGFAVRRRVSNGWPGDWQLLLYGVVLGVLAFCISRRFRWMRD